MTNTNQTNTGNQKIDRIAVVTPNFRIWSGESVLRESDIKLGQGGSIPPKEVAKLGRKALIDKMELLPFKQIKDRFVRLIHARGIAFLGGYAMDVDAYKCIKSDLDHYVEQFKAEVDNLCQNLDQLTDDWIAKNPDYADSIRADKKSSVQVRECFRAGFTVNRIQPLDDEEDRAALEKAVDGLYEKLMGEIAHDAKEYLTRSLTGNVEITQKARTVLNRIRSKLRSLKFLNPKISVLVELLGRVDAVLPQKGMLRDTAFLNMYSVMSTLSDPTTIEDVVEGKLSIVGLMANLQPSTAEAGEESCPLAEPTAEIPSNEGQGDLFLTYEEQCDPQDIEPKNEPEAEPTTPVVEEVPAAQQAIPSAQERDPALNWF